MEDITEMRNLQQKLNEEKYILSEKIKVDMSGLMDWCKECPFQNNAYKKCDLLAVSRDVNTVCARNYNRIQNLKRIRGEQL